MTHVNELIPRVLRDIDNGILALDLRGRIIYMNPQCGEILGREDLQGRSYGEAFLDDPRGRENDPFHQFVLDAVYRKEQTHRGTVPFTDREGARRHIRITASFLRGEDGGEPIGVVLVLSDVTEAETMRKKRQDATVFFCCLTACLCLYLLVVGACDFWGLAISAAGFTWIVNGIAFVFCWINYKKTDFTRADMGLTLAEPKKTVGTAALISVLVVGVLVLTKLILLRRSPEGFPAGAPFWNWDIGAASWLSYAAVCVMQEFMARGIVHGGMRKIFEGPSGAPAAILLSALVFGALHIAHGFLYMVGAILLLGLLGGLYEKQRSIWGVAIIHYVLGQAVTCLGFFG